MFTQNFQLTKLLILLIGIEGVLSACVHVGVPHEDGEEWAYQNSFVMRCDKKGSGWTVSIKACLTDNGDEIPLGTNKTINDRVWECRSLAHGSVAELYSNPTEKTPCREHKSGEEWLFSDVFKIKCGPYGKWQFLGCQVDNKLYPEGEKVVVNGQELKCFHEVKGDKEIYQLVAEH